MINEPNEAADLEVKSEDGERRIDAKPAVSSKRPMSSTASFFFKGSQSIASTMHRLQKLSQEDMSLARKRRRQDNWEPKTMAESLDISSSSAEDEKQPVHCDSANSDASSSAPDPRRDRLFTAPPAVEFDPELVALLAKYSVQASKTGGALQHARASNEQPRAVVCLTPAREGSPDALNIRLHVERYADDKTTLYTCPLGHTFGEILEAVERVSAAGKIALFFRDAPIISTSSTPTSLQMLPGDTVEALSAAAMKDYRAQRQTEQARRAELVEAAILHVMGEERGASEEVTVPDAASHATMTVKVRISAKQVESFDASLSMTIKELLRAVAAKLERPDLHASLVWDGRLLPLTETIGDADIEDGDLLELRMQSVK